MHDISQLWQSKSVYVSVCTSKTPDHQQAIHLHRKKNIFTMIRRHIPKQGKKHNKNWGPEAILDTRDQSIIDAKHQKLTSNRIFPIFIPPSTIHQESFKLSRRPFVAKIYTRDLKGSIYRSHIGSWRFDASNCNSETRYEFSLISDGSNVCWKSRYAAHGENHYEKFLFDVRLTKGRWRLNKL